MLSEKRSLTVEEIENIIKDVLQYNTTLANTNIKKELGEYMRSNLEKIKIYPRMIYVLKEELIKQYETSQISPGESVGVIAACSLGEKSTQMTLDSFHHSGISNLSLVTGIPRFSELLDVSKNPKFCQFVLVYRV
jgi:hypothetical protein